MIKLTTIQYQTSDGRVFDTESEAKAHEEMLSASDSKTTLDNGMVITKDNVTEYFRLNKCERCPFSIECTDMTNFVRRYTTNTFTLCDAVLHTI